MKILVEIMKELHNKEGVRIAHIINILLRIINHVPILYVIQLNTNLKLEDVNNVLIILAQMPDIKELVFPTSVNVVSMKKLMLPVFVRGALITISQMRNNIIVFKTHAQVRRKLDYLLVNAKRASHISMLSRRSSARLRYHNAQPSKSLQSTEDVKLAQTITSQIRTATTVSLKHVKLRNIRSSMAHASLARCTHIQVPQGPVASVI